MHMSLSKPLLPLRVHVFLRFFFLFSCLNAFKKQHTMDNPPLTDNNSNTADERPEKPSVHQNLLVAAIDFGTAYSGYAFLSRKKYEKDPLNIQIPEWDTNRELISHKTPTSILFNKKGEFDKFGNEAERKFKESSENDNEKGSEMYFFQKFKMMLFEQCGGCEDKIDVND